MIDADGNEVEPVSTYLMDLLVGDCSPRTCRSYAYDLLRWFRVLWFLDVEWSCAAESHVVSMVGWLRTASNPQRRRRYSSSPQPGSVNPKTGKRELGDGYAPRTINHALSVIRSFYAFHAHFGRGPVINPIPESPDCGRLRHRSPLEPAPAIRRARLRQAVPEQLPRSIPDKQWEELFDAMGCDRDRSLLLFYVSSAARASELLAVRPEDVDWSARLIYVVSKGTRLRQAIPASPKAFVYLARYLDKCGPPAPGTPLWRTRRGPERPLTYWAMRRVVQRANELLGANWTLHDLRHTAATRMANDPGLTLVEVQAILRHAHLDTTGTYLRVRVEDMFDKLTDHYERPRPERKPAAGYDPADLAAVFGG
ncbi:tyrosine-type recombinase/integrase [Saccharopolyspora sp. CA-218241]|uniref:tyrosine-type recombinase/integrase n=1 Tax=Saccharopolyspora sp. CA-218241 TaxID=3240027 RepID=UPI003D97E9DE